MKVFHYGHAIVGFEGALDATKQQVADFIHNVTSLKQPDETTVDEDTGKIINSGGYEIDKSLLSEQPERYQNLRSAGISRQDIEFLDLLDETMAKCFVEYVDLFPVAQDSVEWRTNGYLIKYGKGQSMGPHSDSAIPKIVSNENRDDSMSRLAPIMNTLTAGIILNDDYDGGELHFRQWGVTPRTPALSAVIYPSAFSGCHEVFPITSGFRYAFLCWYGQGPGGGYQLPMPAIQRRSDVRRIDVGYQKIL